MEQQVLSQIVVAWVVTQAVQWAKRASGLPWISAKTDTLNKIVGIVLAFFSSLGIIFTFDPQAGTLLVTGLTLTTLLTGIWTWVQQVVLQQIIYRGAVKETPVEVKATAKALAVKEEENRG